MAQMQTEGVEFRPNSHVGVNVDAEALIKDFDAVALCGGSEKPRDLPVPGRELDGVHFAMEFLTQQNRRVAGSNTPQSSEIMATGKHVVVIGGGDTGSDCVGTSNRHGAASVTQLELMPQPPEKENKALTWPDWPMKLRTSSSHQEGAVRDFAVMTKAFTGEDGKVTGLKCVRADWSEGQLKEVPDSEFTLPADLILLAMGFLGPRKQGMIEQSGVELTDRGNVDANVQDYRTSDPAIWACGDMRRGQSLIVWAIREGRQCAASVDDAEKMHRSAAKIQAHKRGKNARRDARKVGEKPCATAPRTMRRMVPFY